MDDHTVDELYYEMNRLKKRMEEAKVEYMSIRMLYERALRLEAERSQQAIFQEG